MSFATEAKAEIDKEKTKKSKYWTFTLTLNNIRHFSGLNDVGNNLILIICMHFNEELLHFTYLNISVHSQTFTHNIPRPTGLSWERRSATITTIQLPGWLMVAMWNTVITVPAAFRWLIIRRVEASCMTSRLCSGKSCSSQCATMTIWPATLTEISWTSWGHSAGLWLNATCWWSDILTLGCRW